MGVLDDLRRKAEAQRSKAQAENLHTVSAQDYYLTELLPRLQSAYNYFKELADNLNYVNPKIHANYPIQPEGRYLPLRQGDYKVHTDRTKEFKEMLFRFGCALEQPLIVNLTGKDKVLAYSSDLDRYRIKHERKDFKDANFELERALFRVEGPVNVSVMFKADIEARTIRLMLRNVEQSGVVQHPLKVEQIDKDFFDKLAAYLLRESNELVRLEITDSHREQIRQKGLEEQNHRATELAEAERVAAEETAIEKSHRQSQRLVRQEVIPLCLPGVRCAGIIESPL